MAVNFTSSSTASMSAFCESTPSRVTDRALRRVAPVQNMHLAIASRTAEWQISLGDTLRDLWGKDALGVHELAPLTRDQVLEAAKVRLTEPERFQETVTSEVVSFAVKPLTLDLLMRLWEARGGSFAADAAQGYGDRLSRTLRTRSARRKPFRAFAKEVRIAVIKHIAATAFFCNRTSGLDAPSQAQMPPSDISLSDLATGFVTWKQQRLQVTQSVVQETLNTGLFTSEVGIGWVGRIQTYGEVSGC